MIALLLLMLAGAASATTFADNVICQQNLTSNGAVIAHSFIQGPNDGQLNIKTHFGSVQIGPTASDYTSYNTDRNGHMFDKNVFTKGKFSSSGRPSLDLATDGTIRMSITAANGDVKIPKLGKGVTSDANLRVDSTGRLFSQTTRNDFVILGACDFRPYFSADAYTCGPQYGASVLSASAQSIFTALVAPVHIPTGAIVTNFTAWILDFSVDNLQCYLQFNTVNAVNGGVGVVTSSGKSFNTYAYSPASLIRTYVEDGSQYLSVECHKTPTSGAAWNTVNDAIYIMGARVDYTVPV